MNRAVITLIIFLIAIPTCVLGGSYIFSAQEVPSASKVNAALNEKYDTPAPGTPATFERISSTTVNNTRGINIANHGRYAGPKTKGTLYFDNMSGFCRCNEDNVCSTF